MVSSFTIFYPFLTLSQCLAVNVHDPRQLIFLRKSDYIGCAVLLCLVVFI